MRPSLIERVRRDQEVGELRRQLYVVRETVIEVMPPRIRPILESYYHCVTRPETYKWEGEVVEQLLEFAERLAPTAPSHISNRANCPLCGRGAVSPYESGFSLPEGLTRHLTGRGRGRQCRVMDVALDLARDFWNGRFLEHEERERATKVKITAKRRAGETLYQVVPGELPKLLDDGVWFGESARNVEQLRWAEGRLTTLGFDRVTADRVVSYTKEADGFCIYADLRMKGRITFRIYRKPLPKKSDGPRLRSSWLEDFYLRDEWRHDLPGKLQKRLAEAIGRLDSRPRGKAQIIRHEPPSH